jgi:hypothetical protein
LSLAAYKLFLTVDHVIPRSNGGKTEESNLAAACIWCNSRKWKFTHGKDPDDTGGRRVVRLFNPREQSWHDHFVWDPTDESQILGKTAVGRATIDRLAMNEPLLTELRRLLMLDNRHPPSD